MFTSPLGRLRFFAYSAALLLAEIVAVIVCISATMGIKGLADSPPGPSREPLALAILIVSIVLLVARCNIAWRRSRDAEGSKWPLGMYMVFSTFFALLQAATFLVYKFGGDNSNVGLNLLGLVVLGLWVTLLVAPSAGGSRPSASLEDDPRRTGTGDGPASAPLPSAPAARPAATDRRAGFGKRGLA